MEETLEALREVTVRKASLADRIDKFLADKKAALLVETPGEKKPPPSTQLSTT